MAPEPIIPRVFLQQDIGIDRISTGIVQKKEPVLIKQAPFGIGCK